MLRDAHADNEGDDGGFHGGRVCVPVCVSI